MVQIILCGHVDDILINSIPILCFVTDSTPSDSSVSKLLMPGVNSIAYRQTYVLFGAVLKACQPKITSNFSLMGEFILFCKLHVLSKSPQSIVHAPSVCYVSTLSSVLFILVVHVSVVSSETFLFPTVIISLIFL